MLSFGFKCTNYFPSSPKRKRCVFYGTRTAVSDSTMNAMNVKPNSELGLGVEAAETDGERLYY